jgi:hypothetical protein
MKQPNVDEPQGAKHRNASSNLPGVYLHNGISLGKSMEEAQGVEHLTLSLPALYHPKGAGEGEGCCALTGEGWRKLKS